MAQRGIIKLVKKYLQILKKEEIESVKLYNLLSHRS